MEIKNGSWGRLKSGAGWINVHKSYCTKVNNTATSTKNTTTTKKSNESIAKEVIQGKWGNGTERKKKLEAAGYNYSAIQQIVNKLCKQEETTMKNKIAKLIDVKSIVTLILTAVFSYLAIKGKISGSEFLTIFTVIIGFYFGTQAIKNNKNDNEQ